MTQLLRWNRFYARWDYVVYEPSRHSGRPLVRVVGYYHAGCRRVVNQRCRDE